MKALVRNALGRGFDLDEVDIASPTGREVLVDVHASGVWQTDLLFATHDIAPAPSVLGHEVAGIVAAVGSDMAQVRVGDCLVIHRAISLAVVLLLMQGCTAKTMRASITSPAHAFTIEATRPAIRSGTRSGSVGIKNHEEELACASRNEAICGAASRFAGPPTNRAADDPRWPRRSARTSRDGSCTACT
jgi:hypothetical protein